MPRSLFFIKKKRSPWTLGPGASPHPFLPKVKKGAVLGLTGIFLIDYFLGNFSTKM
jgi:hypothetical protein